MKKFVAVMTAAAMLTSLSACGASASTASSAAESTASSAAADSTTGSTADATTYKVAIVQQLDHASLDEIRTAIEAELDAKAAAQGYVMSLTDGATPQDTRHIPFKLVRRPMFPLDDMD